MTFSENIARVFAAATPTDVVEGMVWYRQTHLIAREQGDVSVGAGILSALSPRLPWGRNVTLARMAFHAPLTGGALTRSIDNANAIREGADPLSVLGGLKTRAFFDNIVRPYSSPEVTVDTHAIKVAGLNRDSVGKILYREIADAYREVAASNDMSGLEMQAVTWIAWKNGRVNRSEHLSA